MHRKAGITLLVAGMLSLVLASSASAAVNARGSVEQAYATDLTAGANVELLNSGNQVIRSATANDLGGALFRNLAAGPGYKIRSGGETSTAFGVLSKEPTPQSTAIYNQSVKPDGYGYIKMRDGVELAYATHPPSDILSLLNSTGINIPLILEPLFNLIPSALNKTPTLIEYSGYGTADPDGPESGIAILANLMGYTVVDVNLRGTGCSAGAYDFFETLQGLDGYDVIETVARQPWVANGKVGMYGISFGGISQLFVAQNRPPSLAGITPISVIDQTQTTLYPGGILNSGFAFSWALDRVHDALPASPTGGQPWAYEQIQSGDTECAENQALHPEAVDLVDKIRENDNYIPEVADPLSPQTFVDKINVPTFLACQWTDEQTGGSCPTIATKMLGADNMPGPEKEWFTFANGTHVDSLQPETMNRLFKFMEIYVGKTAPSPLKATVLNAASSLVFDEVFGIEGMSGRFDTNVQTYDQAKAEFEAQKPVRILYDNGAGGDKPGEAYPAYERDYDSFPAPGTTGRSWYFGPDGRLTDAPATAAAADGFAWNGANGAKTNFGPGNTSGGTNGLWTDTPAYHWDQDPAGTSVSYATEPMTTDTTVLGAGAVDAWVRSSKPNVDLEVTVSEIRPDGKETFVQGGWMRGDARELDPAKSTELAPVLSLREADAKPLPADQFVKVTIPLYYEGHAYRAGSRIQVRVSAPGGDQPVWAFAETPNIQADVAIARGPGMPSRLLLPISGDGPAPTGLPPCPGLRGEPCRDYQASINAPAPLTIGTGQQATTGATPKAAKKCKKRKKRKRAAAAKEKKKSCKKKKRKKRH